MFETYLLERLKALRNAIVDELDMDAVSDRLGCAINEADEAIKAAIRVPREDTYGDQPKEQQ